MADSAQTLQVHRILPKTRAEGPGLRYCIWVQGCHRHCKGCFSPHTWDPEAGEAVYVSAILQEIAAIHGLEGVTFLGGEPFEQAGPLSAIAEAVKAMGLSLVVFTGYTYADLLAKDDDHTRVLLSHTDILMDGPYVEALRDLSRPWVGSSNQEYHFLSGRYTQEMLAGWRSTFEVRIDKTGRILLNGFGDTDELLGRM